MKLILDTVTPVHIGSGENIEPYEYVITDKFYKINLDKFIESLEEQDRNNFLEISAKNLVQARQFIKNKANLALIKEYTAKVSEEVRKTYNTKIIDPKSELSIQTFIKSMDKPFLPGSSVKGAIRTALLWYCAEKELQREYPHNIEQKLFKYKNPQDDPFRALKISDSGFIPEEKMQIYNIKTYTKRASLFNELGFNIFIEGTNAYFPDGKSEMVSFVHTLHLDDSLQKYNYLNIKLSPDIIIKACKEFYGALIANELEFFRGESAEGVYLELEKLKGLIKDKSNRFLLRIGWGSQFDGVTINLAMQNRDLKKSRKLINSKYPLGWILAEIK
ncbi:MAG TPA: type III-A CRISPR-associated RAMP protein Csm5 [Methanosarcinales archaeon]|nr:type III-A CRISPR-associated RAMP protein Csm5 [Methanosarcinales archaeon]